MAYPSQIKHLNTCVSARESCKWKGIRWMGLGGSIVPPVGGLLLLCLVSWSLPFCLMYSSTSADWDDFDRLGLGDYDEMAPRTRQQTRAGYETNEDIRYRVRPPLGNEDHQEREHVYELDYEPSEALRQGISQQGKNISYNIDVAHGQSGGVEYFGIEFFQKITVWVDEEEKLQCSCGHQVQAQEERAVEACEHIYFILDQIAQSHIKWRIEARQFRPMDVRTMFVDKAGTVVKYEARNKVLRSFPPFQMIRDFGIEEFKKDMLFRRTSHDEVQFIKRCHDRITDYFRELDLYVLDEKDPEYSVEECAERLIRIDDRIYDMFEHFSPLDPRERARFARDHVVPTLLHLLHGVVIRNRDDFQITHQHLPSRNLYGLIIQRHPPHRRQFVLETLRIIPPEVITEEQREEQQKILQGMEYPNRPLSSGNPALEFRDRLANLWPNLWR